MGQLGRANPLIPGDIGIYIYIYLSIYIYIYIYIYLYFSILYISIIILMKWDNLEELTLLFLEI